jgi:serine/threonine-protein kinase
MNTLFTATQAIPSDTGNGAARYEILAPLGAGGMATVHVARRTDEDGVESTVALKRLHDFIAEDPQNVAILVDEARLTSSIRHENVVRVLDLVPGEGGAAPSMVMELVEGKNLGAIATELARRDRRMPIDVTVAILCDVLAGLEAAHEAKRDGEALEIVHRDVSPQNILVGDDGKTRITDFGVAKASWRSQQDDGSIQGKLGYMAPEQLEGKCDRRADIFAAGAVLWELLTGARFRSADGEGAQVLVQILYGHLEAPSAHEPAAAVLDDVVLASLCRHAEDRFATAGAMAEALVAVVKPAPRAIVAAFLADLFREAGPVSEVVARTEAPTVRVGRDSRRIAA